ncbi:MAG: rod shape-determining protein MreC [Gammaproteobacteria bacterium]|nr:MAG: rod shape-determining protein MreC [Gammaproteobacteria bacterium]
MDASLGKSLPFKTPSQVTRLVVFLTLSVVLMVADHRGDHLRQIRAGLSVLVYPVQVVASWPVEISRWVVDAIQSDEALQQELDTFRKQQPFLLAKLQKYNALETENKRLRDLLNAANKLADRAMVAELLEVHPEPFTRKLVIHRGYNNDVYIGQPVIDTYGVLGQVTQVGVFTSVVTLITDPSHAVPVQINRNGLRTIALGTGAQDRLNVPFLTPSVDIQEGDLLVTSGLGGGFPPGYPVAKITDIVADPNEAFLQISAKPLAHLNHNRELLLIWPGIQKPNEEHDEINTQ